MFSIGYIQVMSQNDVHAKPCHQGNPTTRTDIGLAQLGDRPADGRFYPQIISRISHVVIRSARFDRDGQRRTY
jgi:hypothetical protein